MKNKREFTSIECSIKLFKLGITPDCEEKYFWQKMYSTEYQKQLEDQGERIFVGPIIQQGSEALYTQIETICPAYTFQQLLEYLKVCPPILDNGLSAADQIANYIIKSKA